MEHTDAPADDLIPVQQWALLALRNNDTARAIIAKLKHSTVTAPAMRDYHALTESGLAILDARNAYRLTPRGMARSSQLIWRLAQEFEIAIRTERETKHRGFYRRGSMGDRYFL